MDDRHTIANGAVSATVLRRGAELCSLQVGGRELMWQAGPRWPSHAPVLFPIIGELKDHRLRVDGVDYAMERHGFARHMDFKTITCDGHGCSLYIEDTDATRAVFPFAFKLTLTFALLPGASRPGDLALPVLLVSGTVENTGPGEMPCSLGFHPAFQWPLSGASKEGHRIELSDDEAETVGQLDEAGLVARRVPSPLEGRRLALSEAVFAHDALVFDPVRSRSARYVAPDGASIEVSWENASQLGIWTKPGDFVCIEPWHGVASPAGFAGEFRDKPGLMHIAPGGSAEVAMTIAPYLPHDAPG